MGEPQKKSGMALLVTFVVVLALIGYPLSYGPWCAVYRRLPDPIRRLQPNIYSPVVAMIVDGQDWIVNPYLAWLRLWDAEAAEFYREIRAMPAWPPPVF